MDRALKRPSWRRVLVIGGPAAAVMAVVAGLLVAAATAQTTYVTPRASVSIGKVEASVFQDFSPIRATVVAREVISIDAGEGGQVFRILARSGDLVEAGQALVQFNNPELEVAVLERQSRQVAALFEAQPDVGEKPVIRADRSRIERGVTARRRPG